MAKLPRGTYATSDTPRPGAYGIIPVGRSAEPLNGISCNLASICICCRRILFLLWLTLVRWPVYPGRMQTGFCRRHDDYVPSSVTRGRPARHVFECFWKTRGQNIQNQPIPTHPNISDVYGSIYRGPVCVLGKRTDIRSLCYGTFRFEQLCFLAPADRKIGLLLC